MVLTFIGITWASVHYRKQLWGISYHVCVKAILMLPLEMPLYILKFKARTYDYEILEFRLITLKPITLNII